MKNRREFIKVSGTAALGTLLFSSAQAFGLQKSHAVGLQLFTFFNEIDNDVEGTLKKIAAIGYTEIESAFSKKGGYYGMKPKEFAGMLTNLGLSWQSHHVLGAPFKLPPGAKMPVDKEGKPLSLPSKMQNLRDDMQQIIDEVAEGGVPYLVCANIPLSSAEEITQSLDTLNKTAEAATKAGLTFCYHNHDAEFNKVDGQVIYDRLLAETDPAKMLMELDLCWSVKAGVDPVELFAKHPGRFPLWHVKDLDKNKEGPAPVGTGIIDFKRIFANANTAGMKHFFVEHDMPADALASITTSYNNIEKILQA